MGQCRDTHRDVLPDVEYYHILMIFVRVDISSILVKYPTDMYKSLIMAVFKIGHISNVTHMSIQ